MRIKVATQTPLPKHQCWLGITTSLEKQTIHHLRKKIVKDLKLECEPVNIKLLLDDYSLLPQTSIAALVRDGDLVTVKQEVPKNKVVTTKKRKSSTVSEEKEEAKKEDDIEARPIKKTKTSKKHKEKDAKTEKTTKKDIKKDTKKDIKKDTKKDIKKDTKKDIKKDAEKDAEKLIKPKPTGKPFEGIDRTKKRNMRRRLLKKSLRDVTPFITPTPALASTDPELQVEKLNISEPTSTHLLKQNKNKNKHHLKKASKIADTRSHVHYSDKPVDIVETDENQGHQANHYGRAFVTFTESDPQCKGRRGPVREYPIHRVPTLFYAENAIEQEPEVPQVEAQQPEVQQPEVEQQFTVSSSMPVNYDSYPDADFMKNIPSIGAHLAIKTLELTANYTPEISDWKQVILKALDDANATVEYLPGFGKASTKGGKFDIKKHRKKQYDEWGNELVDEDLEDDTMQDDQDMIESIPIANVFAIKTMS